jgi:undecaprenyl-diphosphatase
MRRLYYFIYAICLVLFGLLSYFAHQSGSLPGDSAIFNWLGGIESPFFDSLMRAITALGNALPSVITVAVVVAVLLLVRRWLEAFFIALLPSLAALFTWAIKVAVDRPRPGAELIDNGGLSYPSGHVSHIVVFLGFLCYLMPGLVKKRAVVTALQVIMVILIMLMMTSRIYLGEHWPSDVLAGLMLGGMVLAPAMVVYKHYARRRENAGAA